MARGYPERKEQETLAPDEIVPPDTCPICKRRPADAGRYCGTCAAVLRGDGRAPSKP